jgi:hypothetical protein
MKLVKAYHRQMGLDIIAYLENRPNVPVSAEAVAEAIGIHRRSLERHKFCIVGYFKELKYIPRKGYVYKCLRQDQNVVRFGTVSGTI